MLSSLLLVKNNVLLILYYYVSNSWGQWSIDNGMLNRIWKALCRCFTFKNEQLHNSSYVFCIVLFHLFFVNISNGYVGRVEVACCRPGNNAVTCVQQAIKQRHGFHFSFSLRSKRLVHFANSFKFNLETSQLCFDGGYKEKINDRKTFIV